MGQVALGFRSLLVRALVFFIMAALLAWALGGTLWPAPVQADLSPLTFAGKRWSWRAELDPSPDPPTSVPLQFILVHGDGVKPNVPYSGMPDPWTEQLPLVVSDGHLVAAGRQAGSGQWILLEISTAGVITRRQTFSNRLATVSEWNSLAGSAKP